MAYVTVDVDLYDIDTDDLMEELERRGRSVPDNVGFDGGENHMLIKEIYEARRLGKDYGRQLDELIYNVIGRIL